MTDKQHAETQDSLGDLYATINELVKANCEIMKSLERLEDRQKYQCTKIQRIDTTLHGTAEKPGGMFVRLDRLEQTDKKRRFWITTAVVAVVGQLVALSIGGIVYLLRASTL